MSQDDSANSARIPISLFTISAILLAAANRTTLNDEVQTVNRVTSNLKREETLIDPPDSQDSQPFPSIDDTSDRKSQEIYNVINKSDTFDNLQQNLQEYGINITSKIISINIA